ncbi:MAG: hypothetical protein EPN91_09125 [Salinibacterium sp.]|nr:MAG: hypothetical protein EPN91_09125 [Salinibacterium sp.]
MLSGAKLAGNKLVIGLVAGGALVLGGAGFAAYADILPTDAQQTAHDLFGAPAPADDETITDETTPTPEPSETAVGPDATGPAAHGLCTAFTHGGLAVSSTAYQSLVTAANGAENIATYCATVPAPGKSGEHSHGHGQSQISHGHGHSHGAPEVDTDTTD